MKNTFYFKGIIAGVMIAFLSACATQVTEEPSAITASTERLGQYETVYLVKAKINPPYDGQGPNIKAVNKIDEVLARELSAIFKASPNTEFKVISKSEAENITATEAKSVLLIKPLVKQIKFIGGAARFWAGAMAGSSVVIMDTAFVDAATGQQLANPGYYRKAGAYTDGFGVGSNRMLDDVARDVATYVRTSM